MFYFKRDALQEELVLDPFICPALSFVKALTLSIAKWPENKMSLRLYSELDEEHGNWVTVQLQVGNYRSIVNVFLMNFLIARLMKHCDCILSTVCDWACLGGRRAFCAWYHQNNSLRTQLLQFLRHLHHRSNQKHRNLVQNMISFNPCLLKHHCFVSVNAM